MYVLWRAIYIHVHVWPWQFRVTHPPPAYGVDPFEGTPWLLRVLRAKAPFLRLSETAGSSHRLSETAGSGKYYRVQGRVRKCILMIRFTNPGVLGNSV